jgi:hypothetical protein
MRRGLASLHVPDGNAGVREKNRRTTNYIRCSYPTKIGSATSVHSFFLFTRDAKSALWRTFFSASPKAGALIDVFHFRDRFVNRRVPAYATSRPPRRHSIKRSEEG